MKMTKPAMRATISAVLLTMAPPASASEESDAVQYCAAAGAWSPYAFAACVGGYLGEEEIRECKDGHCFGVSIPDIEKYGSWCGGPNSLMSKIFGHKSAICGGKCTGKIGVVYIENHTGRSLSPKAAGKCSKEETLKIAVHDSFWYGYVPGDQWIWVWGKGVSGPRTVDLSTTTVSWGDPGGHTPGGRWRLLSGHMYRFVVNDDGDVIPVEISPPRYGG